MASHPRVTAVPRPPQVPVIVIAAKDLTVEDRRRLNGGAERIIQKSATTREELLAEVRTVMQNCVHKKF